MICKRITNFGGENRIKEFDKYEFEINIVSKKESLDNNAEKTIIVIEDETDIDNVVDSITHSIIFPGLITTSIADLHEIFHNSGVWYFKHIIKNTANEIINELSKIGTDKMFICFHVNENKTLFEYDDIIESIHKNETLYLFFSLPVETNNQEHMEVSVFYK